MGQRAQVAAPSGGPVTEGAAQEGRGELLLEVADLSIDYGDGDDAVHAVDRVSLMLHRGEALGIAGESGSGKSTLAHGLARLLRPPAVATGGTVRYHPRPGRPGASSWPVDVLALQGEELRLFRWQEIAIVLQSAMNALNPVITIRDQLHDTLLAHRPEMRRAQADRRAAELLELVGVSADRLSSYPHQLSGGMRQRVLIAMALALDPELLIMDEPTTALDVVTQRQILQELAALRARLGFAMVFITHDLSLLLEVSDTIAIMYAGRIVETASGRQMYERPAHPYSAGLLRSFPPLTGPKLKLVSIPGSPPDLRSLPPGCAFRPRCPRRMDICGVQEPGLLHPHTFPDPSHRVACWLHAEAPAQDTGSATAAPDAGPLDAIADLGLDAVLAGPESGTPTTGIVPVLEARHLVKHFPVRGAAWKTLFRTERVVHAVDDVTLALRAGMVDALVGESGSGKSTVAKLLAQLERPTTGEIVLKGEPAGERGGRRLRAYRRDVQIVFQDPFASLNPLHTVAYHIGRPLRVHRLVAGASQEREQVLRLLERVKLTPALQFLDKLPHELSGGQRQRVAIARALAVQPQVLLADEPVSMLDVSIRLSILDLLAELRRDDHLALLYVTHDVASARYFADTISVMYAGRVVEAGPAEQVVQEPRHPYTQLLLSAVPNPDAAARRLHATLAPGEPPSLIDPPSGCRFHPRCPHARDVCRTETPPPIASGAGHWAACWMLSGYSRPDGQGASEGSPDGSPRPAHEPPARAERAGSDGQAD